MNITAGRYIHNNVETYSREKLNFLFRLLDRDIIGLNNLYEDGTIKTKEELDQNVNHKLESKKKVMELIDARGFCSCCGAADENHDPSCVWSEA